MKKLFNSRFLFILASSLVVLIGLTVGAFYLFDDEDDTFIKSGYVLNPLSSTSEKYFFEENVGYKENLSSMIEFVDVDEKTVSVLKDSFLHYNDDSLSFLKKGAILDLDTIKGNKAVSFYNITKESVIEKKDSGYFIESAAGDVRLINFIGRISENKYIIVGDLSLKMAGNDTTVKGDYFEVVYVEEGIVNIENKSVKYQVTAEGTSIYVGNNIVIDFGDKKIVVDGEDKMSLTAITINGDENIEIIPKAEEEEEPTEDDNNGENNNVGDDSQIGTGEEGNEDGGTEGGNIEIKPSDEVVVTLKNAKTGSTNINVIFDVINAKTDDIFKLQVVNLNSGRTVDIVAEVITDVEIKVNLLTPNTKYLFMVINEKDNGKYFQKVLETSGFGIKMEKSYATESSLSYKITIDEGTDITNAKLALYKFNEETLENEIVTDSFVDSVTGEVTTVEKVTYLSSLKGNLEGEHEILFDGLDSNTIYTAVLDEFSVASSNFKDIYNVTITAMTLKQVPKFSEMTITKDVGAGSFDLSLGNITDPDNAIVGYTYVIYDRLDDKLAIEPIVHNNASPITVKVGDGDNQLKNDTNYYYKVIIEYFDNEKYIEYVTSDSIIFMMGNDPYVTVVPNDEIVSHDKIGATIYLTDNSCLISMPGREKCSGNSTTIVEVSRVNSLTGERVPVFTKLATFDVTEEDIKYDLYVDNLTPGTIYTVDVRANFNNSDALEKQEILHTDESKRTITTKSLSSFEVDWKNNQGTPTHVIDATVKLVADENSGTLSPEESINSVNKVVLKLYDGRSTGDLDTKNPIATKTIVKSNIINLKAMFYDTAYAISSLTTFGLTMDDLKKISGKDKLNEYYTLTIDAYTETDYKINLIDNVYSYRVSSILLMGEIEEPVIKIEPITNKGAGSIFSNLTNGATTVGYTISAAFDRNQLIINNILPQRINFYVYNNNSEKKEKIKFYIMNEAGELELVDKFSADLDENGFYDAKIYMDYGTPYETVDEIMRRGNSFYIGYEIETLADGQTLLYPVSNDKNSPSSYGVYKFITADKETPNIKMYIAKTDAKSVSYSYTIDDPDNAIYKETNSDKYGFYYTINEGSEKKYELVQDESKDYNRFEGRITIDGLRKYDLYKLYYKKNIGKTGEFTSDVVNYLDGYSSGVRMFEGHYDAANNISSFNFKYKIINNPLKDNKVVIRIMATDEVLTRILSYRISFKDSKGNSLNKELWQLSSCDGDREDDLPRCLSVDYTELKNAGMKSDNNETNTIRVDVTALYDNGLTGFDYKVGSNDGDDYLYCIMQDNSSEAGMGNYIVFSSSGQQVTIWNETLGAPKGYYTYTLNKSLLFYKSQLNVNHRLNISVNLSSSGYSSKNGFLNPKMISVDKMECTGKSGDDCNSFSFNSITPKVAVTEKAPIINGNVLNLTLSGVDLNDIKLEDGNYYLYVETWEKLSDAGDLDKVVRPVVKVKVNGDNPTKTVSGLIDGLKENTTYYYNVYAYMNKNGNFVYTQLFDSAISDRYQVTTYQFKTARASDLFHSLDVNYTSSDKIYGNRDLNTKINLLAYKNSISFNFDIIYVLCEVGTTDCGPDEGNTHIFKKIVPLESINSTIINDTVDISEYDLEFGKNYYMYIYASADYYSSASADAIVKRNVVLNRYNINIKLKALTEPSFVVTREAFYDGEEHFIDFNIVVSDVDRTLVGGNYFIKLLDDSGNLVGNMQLKGTDGIYYDVSNYDEYAFDAFVVKKDVRIRGLEPDTKYSFVVYNDAYLNNYSEEIPKEDRTYEVKRSYTVYSTNDYGVAFGRDITYSATEKSIIVTFLGGSNFDNVTEVNYTVGLWDDEASASTVSGTFVIGQNNKYFEMYKDSSDWRFVLDPPGMKNTLGKTYEVNISFKLKVPGTDKFIVLTSADVPGFEGKAVYVEDE